MRFHSTVQSLPHFILHVVTRLVGSIGKQPFFPLLYNYTMCVQVAEKGVAHLKHQTNDKNSELEDAVLFREVDMCWNRPDGRVKLHHVETTTQRSPCIFALQEQ